MFANTVLLSLCASYAYAAFTPPARINVPCRMSRTGRPILSVTMGTQGFGQIQDFNFTFTTSLGYTSVAGSSCRDCSNTPLYDIGLSPQARSLDGTPAISLGSGTLNGTLIKENCTLTAANGASWPYTNQTIIVLDNQSATSPFSNGVSGLVGLGTLQAPTNTAGFAADFYDSLYGQYYIRNPDAVNFTFGMSLKPAPVIPSDSNTLSLPDDAPSLEDAGTVHWLQPDPSSYQENKVQWRTVQGSVTSGYLANNQQPDWTVQLDGWAAKIGSSNINIDAPFLANIDPYYSGIYMPGNQARLINDAIPGSQSVQWSTIPGETTSWSIPCNTAFSFTVTIGDQQFLVDQSLLVVHRGDGTCTSLIEGFTDSSVTQYILGQNWISQLYIIFNIPKSGDPQLAFAPRAGSTRSRDIGAIVGGTVGGVAAVVAIGLVAFYFLRRRSDKLLLKHTDELITQDKDARTVVPYITSPHYAQSMHPGVVSPPVSPHQPLLASPDPRSEHHFSPDQLYSVDPRDPYKGSYEPNLPTYEQSVVSSPTTTSYPREKGMRSMTNASNPPSPNDQTSFSGPSNLV